MTHATHPLTLAMAAAMDLPDTAAAPDWVHLLPAAAGSITTFDGRGPYRVQDADQIIAASFADPRGLPIDENHATDLAAPKGQPAPARGWIKELQARVDGIWGRVEWTEAGRALVADRAYRGLSPVFMHDKTGVIARIARASLVNTPNLRGLTALNQETRMSFMDQLAASLGLSAGAKEEDILAAIPKGDTALQSAIIEIGATLGVAGSAEAVRTEVKRLKAETGALVPALQAQVEALQAQVKTMTDGQAKKRAEEFFDRELAQGRMGLNQGNRAEFIALHMDNPERTEKLVQGFALSKASPATATPPVAADGSVALQSEHLMVAAQLGLSAEAFSELLKKEAR